jgi:hypothetical protein
LRGNEVALEDFERVLSMAGQVQDGVGGKEGTAGEQWCERKVRREKGDERSKREVR